MFSSWANRPNDERAIEKSCGDINCIRKLMVGAAIVRCAGSCGKEFHIDCTGISKADYETFKKYDNVSYRCDDCLTIDNEMKTALGKINQKLCSVLTSVISKQSSLEIKLSERISKIEDVMQESGKSIVNGMSKMVEEVTKVVEEKSTEMTKVMENTLIDAEPEWQTVEKKKKKQKDKVVVIKPTTSQSRVNLKKSLRSSIDSTKFNVNGISKTSSNGIAVKCGDDESVEKLIDEIKEKFGENVNLIKPKKVTPRVKILRVNDPEDDDDAFVSQIKARNDSLKSSTIKVIRREATRRRGQIIDGVFNMVLEIDDESYEKIMEEKKVKHHFEVYNVVDSIYIRRCYNCWGFNHHRADCVHDLACAKCAGPHETSKCESGLKKCVNCVKFNERTKSSLDINHDVWSNQCGVYKMKLERSKKIFAHIK